ncbi:MAG TPA: bifunctional class I SAM-dependent methyltransferase/glycosyltransferase family 2 protein [Caulobacterales bacterium]|nr:bifunctional class I SAM-dependent methyltransferase/glycosyltransferase family 2 protein [Caulobacterales bacterium]
MNLALADPTKPGAPASPRNTAIAKAFDALARQRHEWRERNAYYYERDLAYTRFLIPEGLDVIEIGCGTGDLLAGLKPARGVGVDISGEMVTAAKARHPNLEFVHADAEAPGALDQLGVFDVVLISDTVGLLEDIASFFRKLRPLLKPETRIIVAYYSRLWEPVLQLATKLGWRMPTPAQSWLSTADIMGMMEYGDLEPLHRDWRILVPRDLLGVGSFINKFIAPLPGIRRLCLRNYVVARPAPQGQPATAPSCSVLVPCRNEKGNIENAVKRLPHFAPNMEIVFIEGHSADGTYEECRRVQAAYPDRAIKVFKQTGKGKGDAMKLGFASAAGDIVLILDSDLTVRPEDMPKFYHLLASRRGEFVNGTRLVYPRQEAAMRGLNYLGNRFFAGLFSYLLNQRLTDTLCGTKAMWRADYERLAANRKYFGDFDPFGDFDMLLGAAKMNLKIVELPVRYYAREYGEPQIDRFRDGMILLRMAAFAWTKLKAL